MENNINDILKTLGLIFSPLIAGFIFFNLTRKKEYTYKKRELCGEIYGNIFELRQIYLINTFHRNRFKGFERIYQLRNDPDYIKNFPRPDDQGSFKTEEYQKLSNDADIARDRNYTQLIQIEKNLYKVSGQYRLYLSIEKRVKYDEFIAPIYKIRELRYDFNLKNIREIEERIEALNKSYPQEFSKQCDLQIKAVHNFLEENN